LFEFIESDLVFVLEPGFHRLELDADLSSLEFLIVLLLSELTDFFEQRIVFGGPAGPGQLELLALFEQQLDVSPVSFIDECEIGELAAVIEGFEIEREVLFGELFESSLCFIAFVAVSTEILGLPRAVFLEAAAAFFLPSDFEPDFVERIFALCALFSELFLVVLDRGGLCGEFLLSVGRGLLFLVCGFQFLLAGSLCFFESAGFCDERLAQSGRGFEFTECISGIGFESSHAFAGVLAL
jgi:hypothetical protein